MTTTETIEKLIKAYIDGDSNIVIDVIEDKIKEAKGHGHDNVARRLRNMVSRVPRKVSFFDQNSIPHSKSTTLSTPLYLRVNSNVSLKEVILDKTISGLVEDFLSEWKNADKLIKHRVYPTNKLLLYGPPGTGKTKLAYALANALDLPLVIVRLDELISSFLGKTGKNIREVFDLAEKENVIILLDEIDTIAKHRDDNHELGELKRVVTVLLQNIDNFPSNSIVIGATNHEILLDKAVWRRFPLRVGFELPAEKSREQLFRLYLGAFLKEVNLEILIKLSGGLNGSAIYEMCQNIKKYIILNSNRRGGIPSSEILIKAASPLGLYKNSKTHRQVIYNLCKDLFGLGCSLTDLEKWSGISYTTLRDNVK